MKITATQLNKWNKLDLIETECLLKTSQAGKIKNKNKKIEKLIDKHYISLIDLVGIFELKKLAQQWLEF